MPQQAQSAGDTREIILAHGRELLRDRGYAGLNYSAISDKLGIKNAAIHYHFRKKEDLAREIIENAMRERVSRPVTPPLEQLDRWFDSIRSDCLSGSCICLVGCLVPDLERMPGSVRAAIDKYSMAVYGWTCQVLEAGKRDGSFVYDSSTESMALAILSAMQGARQIVRLRGMEPLDVVIKQIRASLGVEG